jgi:RNA polymerase sigma-70 factor (ECF subfamily)
MLEQSRVPNPSDAASGLQAKRAVDSVQTFTDLPDLLLVERTRGRDTRAFETLMRRYNRRLYRIARSILSNDEMAEEAVRAAYIRAFANLDRYEPAGKFGAWLARLAFNEALTLRRHSPTGSTATASASAATPAVSSHPARAPAFGAEGADSASAADGGDPVASKQQLEAAIDALPEVFRTVLVLRVVEDLSGVEVAVCLGLNETTVRTRLYRAQQRLKADVARRLRAEPFNIFELTPERCDRIVSQVFTKVHAVSPVVSDAR